MESDRATAEQQLTSLLNRALKNVPLVKLDAVDEVVKLFTEAIDLMESNQVLDDDDEDSRSTPVQSSMDGQSKLLALAASTASTATNSSSSSANNSDSENGVDARGQPVLVNKAVAGLANAALTVDYSSPSSKTRSLGGKAAPSKPAATGGSTGLGLGLKSAGGSGSGPKPGVLGLGHGGTHKPSSRATTGLNALSASAANSPSSGTSSRAVDSTSPVSPITPNDEAGENGDGQMVLKNKLLSKVSTGGSREYPSPKLGPRSLSSTPKASSPQNPAAAGLSLPVADSLGRDGLMTAPPANATPTSPADADDEGADADNPDDAEGDLIRTDVKNNVFNRVKQELPVTASPKQIRSSFHLLELATTHGLQTDEPDLTQQPHGSQTAEAVQNKSPTLGERPINVLSALPTGLQSNSASSTPKPAYLRRLDSPDTHHGQLLAAKSRLQLLINRGLQVADKVKLDKVPEIKAALEKALAKLESSLVQPSLGPQ